MTRQHWTETFSLGIVSRIEKNWKVNFCLLPVPAQDPPNQLVQCQRGEDISHTGGDECQMDQCVANFFRKVDFSEKGLPGYAWHPGLMINKGLDVKTNQTSLLLNNVISRERSQPWNKPGFKQECEFILTTESTVEDLPPGYGFSSVNSTKDRRRTEDRKDLYFQASESLLLLLLLLLIDYLLSFFEQKMEMRTQLFLPPSVLSPLSSFFLLSPLPSRFVEIYVVSGQCFQLWFHWTPASPFLHPIRYRFWKMEFP